ncbi:MAG TPA: hypothetical protein VFO39_16830 [Candidatus Sulfotelmatobacter sp.]|nr:hypothetical protein [Candidatus Sulfotelmatobacter sp.]
MKLRRVLLVWLAFLSAVPALGREAVDPVMQAASAALQNYQQLASRIHCEDATTTDLGQVCKERLESLGMRVQEAQAAIARYGQFSAPPVVVLFDAYQAFRRVMEEVEGLVAASDFYGERTRPHLAEVYNSFVKITGWFGNVVRETIRDADKCPKHDL